MNWKEIALLAGGAAAAGVLLYYLLKDDSADVEASRELSERRKLSYKDVTKSQVLDILRDIIKSQDKMKLIMKELSQELTKHNYDFEKTYHRVKELQPDDPLEHYGLSMSDFDQLLETYQEDPNIREAIARIMGVPGPTGNSGVGSNIPKKVIVEVHEYMLKELQKLVEEFQKLPDRQIFDMKTVTIAMQALVATKVEAQFNVTSEDIEAAVLMHHEYLSKDREFTRINLGMQHIMTKLIGCPYSTER